MKNEMIKLDRLNLVGEMAASIGHEVRNPLTTVRGFLQIIQNKNEHSGLHAHLDIMIGELDRANTIISDYLSLAKSRVTNLKLGNLNDIIKALFPLIRADGLRDNHDVKLELSDIPDTMIDENDIRQLILNLVRNAMEAKKSKGIINIKTYLDNDKITMAVQDNGPGIPIEIYRRIGTPFLTTKENGTGLGLPVCYRIAQRHDAKITVETSDAGTTFYVQFERPLITVRGCRETSQELRPALGGRWEEVISP